MILIADASAVGAFLLPDEAGPFADFARAAYIAHDIHVPRIWPTELASLITTAHRRERITDAERDVTAQQAEALKTGVTIEMDLPIALVARRANETRLNAYDTTYLMLAENLGGTLLTGDGPLRRAAVALGVAVLTP